MRHGFRSALRMAATVVVVAAVARAAASARQIIDHGNPDPPRHRADRPSPMARAVQPAKPLLAPPRYHAFGPQPCIVPSRGAGVRTPAVTELEASGELDDDQLTPTDRLLARRHAADPVTTRPD